MLIVSHKLDNEDVAFAIGIEQIQISVEALEQTFKFNDTTEPLYSQLTSSKRKREWLQVHLLLHHLSGNNHNVVQHDANGKPYMNDYHLSISHAGNFTALIRSKKLTVAIDIEPRSKNIEKGADYFLNEKESAHIPDLEKETYLLLCWCAKETVIKYFSVSGIDFKNNIILDKFVVNQKGKIRASMIAGDKMKAISMHYEVKKDYVFCYAY
jgi:phosphopantetheinyl transferase